ncbi:MAG: hypothetical protein FWE10_02585 [Rikenellaceae bacterium]|nr:hypothetical protein [Rikenellaceae bacterium]MCL2692760.1 hypothetical protein [Rikenellaceae bacterium]
MKKPLLIGIQIFLFLAIVGLAWWLIASINKPIQFDREVSRREADVIQNARDIRAAQRAFRSMYGNFTDDFNELIYFILHDSITVIRSVGSLDDSVAVARGLVYQEETRVAVIDTIFSPRRLTPQQVHQLPIIPHSENKRFFLETGFVTTETRIIVPVFELRAPFNFFLHDMDRQMVDNLIDDQMNTRNLYPGIKVGDLRTATNEALNRPE